MKYKKGDRITVIDTKLTKTVCDSELICETEIYYMSDNTSYSSSQISFFDYSESNFLEIINQNKEKLVELIDTKKLAKSCLKYMDEKNAKSKYSLSLLLNLFPKVSRLWTSKG